MKQRTAIDGSLRCGAAAYIFEVRARRLKRRLDLLTYVGLVGPVIVGAIVGGYGLKIKALEYLLPVAAAVSAIQVVVALWAVIARWQDQYEFAVQSQRLNSSLAEKYHTLRLDGARFISTKPRATEAQDLDSRLLLLQSLDEPQRRKDEEQQISEAEDRMGMRGALRQFGIRCDGCSKVPENMQPTKCDKCGNFPARWVH